MNPIPLNNPFSIIKAWQCSACSDVYRSEHDAIKCCSCKKCGKIDKDRGYACLTCRREEACATSTYNLRSFTNVFLRNVDKAKWEAECYHFSPPDHRGFGSTPEAALADLRAKSEALKNK